jgi:lipopolysaccharide biosynthesis glycosyltransferase
MDKGDHMTEVIRMVVGFDQREAIAYHVFCQSVIDRTSLPVQFLPLNPRAIAGYKEAHQDGSNVFIYTRFLTPYLMNYSGWAIFADGDMICNSDIAELWKLRDPSKAIMVVKHDYQTKAQTKYLGSKNENYPRKNWSSLILWNCEHPDNKQVTPEFVAAKDGAFLHRFKWLDDEKIGDIPKDWNWLAIEYPSRDDAKIIHYTLGTPCFRDYRNTDMADRWHASHNRVLSGMDD